MSFNLQLEADREYACRRRHVIAGLRSYRAPTGGSIVVLSVKNLANIIRDVLQVDPVSQLDNGTCSNGRHLVIANGNGSAIWMGGVRKSAPADNTRLPHFRPEIALLCSRYCAGEVWRRARRPDSNQSISITVSNGKVCEFRSRLRVITRVKPISIIVRVSGRSDFLLGIECSLNLRIGDEFLSFKIPAMRIPIITRTIASSTRVNPFSPFVFANFNIFTSFLSLILCNYSGRHKGLRSPKAQSREI